jgi:hypothetical protein
MGNGSFEKSGIPWQDFLKLNPVELFYRTMKKRLPGLWILSFAGSK